MFLISTEDKGGGNECDRNALFSRQLHVVITCADSDDTSSRHMAVVILEVSSFLGTCCSRSLINWWQD